MVDVFDQLNPLYDIVKSIEDEDNFISTKEFIVEVVESWKFKKDKDGEL